MARVPQNEITEEKVDAFLGGDSDAVASYGAAARANDLGGRYLMRTMTPIGGVDRVAASHVPLGSPARKDHVAHVIEQVRRTLGRVTVPPPIHNLSERNLDQVHRLTCLELQLMYLHGATDAFPSPFTGQKIRPLTCLNRDKCVGHAIILECRRSANFPAALKDFELPGFLPPAIMLQFYQTGVWPMEKYGRTPCVLCQGTFPFVIHAFLGNFAATGDRRQAAATTPVQRQQPTASERRSIQNCVIQTVCVNEDASDGCSPVIHVDPEANALSMPMFPLATTFYTLSMQNSTAADGTHYEFPYLDASLFCNRKNMDLTDRVLWDEIAANMPRKNGPGA